LSLGTIVLLQSIIFAILFTSMSMTHVNADTDKTLEIINQYCFDHSSDIMAGKNPVNDLISSGQIPSSFNGKTCEQISDELQQQKIAEAEDITCKTEPKAC